MMKWSCSWRLRRIFALSKWLLISRAVRTKKGYKGWKASWIFAKAACPIMRRDGGIFFFASLDEFHIIKREPLLHLQCPVVELTWWRVPRSKVEHFFPLMHIARLKNTHFFYRGWVQKGFVSKGGFRILYAPSPTVKILSYRIYI